MSPLKEQFHQLVNPHPNWHASLWEATSVIKYGGTKKPLVLLYNVACSSKCL